MLQPHQQATTSDGMNCVCGRSLKIFANKSYILWEVILFFDLRFISVIEQICLASKCFLASVRFVKLSFSSELLDITTCILQVITVVVCIKTHISDRKLYFLQFHCLLATSSGSTK